MKLFLVGSLSSVHTVKWANILNEKGIDVHVLFNRNDQKLRAEVNSDIQLHELRFKSPIGYFLNAPFLRRLVKIHKPDIIHVHYASGYGTLSRLSKIKNSILSVWGSDIYNYPMKSILHENIIKRNILFSKQMTSTSWNMRERIYELVPEFKGLVTVIPFGVDLNVFQYKTKDLFSSKTIKIGTIKSFEKIYGIDTIIRAFLGYVNEGVRNQEKKYELHLYGDGSQKQELYEEYKKQVDEGLIFFHNRIPNEIVPKVLSEFDIFISGSKEESFGVAIIEAMAIGVPVIATSTKGAIEIINNHEDGILVPIDDEFSIAESIDYYLENNEIAQEIVYKARKKVEILYSLENNAEQLISIYNQEIS